MNQRQVEKVEAQWRGGCIPILPEIRCYSGEGEEVDKRTRGPRGHGGQGEQGKEVGPRGQGGQRGKGKNLLHQTREGEEEGFHGLPPVINIMVITTKVIINAGNLGHGHYTPGVNLRFILRGESYLCDNEAEDNNHCVAPQTVDLFRPDL